MLNVFVLVFLLLYFWYWTRFFDDVPVPRPTSIEPVLSTRRTFTHAFEASDDTFTFTIDGRILWQESIPEEYVGRGDRIEARDLCADTLDGTKIAATGATLYDYLRHHGLTPTTLNASSTVDHDAAQWSRNGTTFYFTCQNQRIDRLESCPPNHVFRHGECQTIDACQGLEDGVTVGDPFDARRYYQCHGDDPATLEECPKDTIFLHDSCRSSEDLSVYCRFHEESKPLDDFRILHCRNGRPVIQTCAFGEKVFDGRCESALCETQPDGTRLAMPTQNLGHFRFSPGYFECGNGGRIIRSEKCEKKWDAYLSKGDNLTHLPMVYDGEQCAIPTFCENVTAGIHSGVIVPVHEFTKFVLNWKHSPTFDRTMGYVCEGGGGTTRKRIHLDPGETISKKFKRASACTGSVEKTVIANDWRRYFDCQTQQVVDCDPQHFFDGTTCIPFMSNAFEYKGLNLFRFNHLSTDGWLAPWTYSKTPLVGVPCPDPVSVHMSNYNLCSHPDCVAYPFLSQLLNVPISLPDGSRCRFDDSKRHLVKEPNDDQDLSHVLYWSQRRVPHALESEPCVFGQKVQSGYFVLDSVLYATCDSTQPFVFCPSPKTAGIRRVLDQRYICNKDDPAMGYLPSNTPVEFEANELKRIMPISTFAALPNVTINNTPSRPILIQGEDIPEGRAVKIVSDGPIKLEYRYRVTHPPDAVFEGHDATVSTKGGSFLMKRKDFSQKALNFPFYSVTESVSDFSVHHRA